MNIALLGYGVVGKGVYDIITSEFPTWNVLYILEKDPKKSEEIQSVVTTSYDVILNDNSVDTVIELIGGKTVAYDFIKQALINKKNVVTANKAVISAYFEELTTLAKENNVSLLYEASVGGAIIVLDPLYKIATHNKINKIEGIINGSTNYVLSRIFLENQTLEDALDEACQLGYIETGSTDDMDGFDLMRKINILSMLAYQTYIKEDDIMRVPLSSITSECIDYIKKNHLTMKYVATSILDDNVVHIELIPTVMSTTDFLSHIHYEENIISLSGTYHKTQKFIGQGAGRYPTAQAVINDLVIINNNEKREHKFNRNYKIRANQSDRYLVQTQSGFETVTDTLSNLMNNKNILCFAKIRGDVL